MALVSLVKEKGIPVCGNVPRKDPKQVTLLLVLSSQYEEQLQNRVEQIIKPLTPWCLLQQPGLTITLVQILDQSRIIILELQRRENVESVSGMLASILNFASHFMELKGPWQKLCQLVGFLVLNISSALSTLTAILISVMVADSPQGSFSCPLKDLNPVAGKLLYARSCCSSAKNLSRTLLFSRRDLAPRSTANFLWIHGPIE